VPPPFHSRPRGNCLGRSCPGGSMTARRTLAQGKEPGTWRAARRHTHRARATEPEGPTCQGKRQHPRRGRPVSTTATRTASQAGCRPPVVSTGPHRSCRRRSTIPAQARDLALHTTTFRDRGGCLQTVPLTAGRPGPNWRVLGEERARVRASVARPRAGAITRRATPRAAAAAARGHAARCGRGPCDGLRVGHDGFSEVCGFGLFVCDAAACSG
jgi:hypothetical protein